MKSIVNEVASIKLPPLETPYHGLMEQLRLPDPALCSRDDWERLAVRRLVDTMASSVGALEVFSWHAGVCEARRLLLKRQLDYIVQTYPLLADAASHMERESVDS
ncbi:MAG: hypothetical protein K2X55_24005 [Burkholderiaceae bacterium]|nr:hypothetical protein [Burkholderiaceae bacterium]